MFALRRIEAKMVRTNLQYILDQGRVVSEAIAKRQWDRQHPLADRHFRNNTIHQMRGRVGHAPPPTRRTKASFLARIRDKPIQSAGIAVNPQKTSGQYAAIQECAQFQFHKARYHPLSLPLPGEEGLQMTRNDTIENRFFGIAGYIRPNTFTHDEIRFGRHECAIAG